MICPVCGNDIDSDSQFCERCGSKIRDEEKLSLGELFCSYCGTRNLDDAVFCENCGHGLKEDEFFGEEPERQQHFGIKIAVIGIVVVIIVGVSGGFWWMLSEKENQAVAAEKTSKKTESVVSDSAKTQEEGSKTAEKSKPQLNSDQRNDTTNNIDEKSEVKTSEFILQDSSSRLLVSSDLTEMSLRELNYARNEIFARHGRKFKSQELQNYFNSKSWYKGTINPEDFDENYMDTLSTIEKSNAEILKKEEHLRSSEGYQLDK